MKKNRSMAKLGALGFLMLLLIFPACKKQNNEDESQHQQQRPMAEVSVVEVQPERVAISTELSGRVSAYLVAEVRPQVGGIIQKTLFTEGSEVNEGDILYQIDPSLYEAAENSAKANLARAEAVLPSARYKAERYAELSKAKAISQQEYDDAVAAAKTAEADVLSARAELERAHINLAYTAVKAPISGRIGKSSVTTGALVTAFQQVALATIQKLDPVYVDVTQASSSLLELRKRVDKGVLKKDDKGLANVKLLLEDGTLYDHEGAFKFSDVTVDMGTASVILRSVFPNPSLKLLPGMFVRAIVEEGINEAAILVPQRCVTRNVKGEPVAMVVGASGTVESRVLLIDRAVKNRWLITDGLSEGDKVIVEGLQKVRPGSKVNTVPFVSKETTMEKIDKNMDVASLSQAEN